MTNKEIIDGLKMTMELITFDPSTGETIDPDNLNDLNRTTYDACNGAIKALEGKDANVPSNVPDTNVGDTISRQMAVKEAKELYDMGDCYCDRASMIGMLNSLPPAQPESCDGCKSELDGAYGECNYCKRNFTDIYEKGEQDENY